MEFSNELLNKYNVQVPRYTSYPTITNWNENIGEKEWKNNFKIQFREYNKISGISLYIHLPFCESLCTYCGCNKKITTNHSVENKYINALTEEWKMYLEVMGQIPIIKEVHLGGGTPTFFSPSNLERLLTFIINSSLISPDHDFSFEGHPNNTTKEHLETLYKLGFRRVSFGVQDHDPEVQKIINRIQPFENIKRATETARQIGYRSINFDLIYGLPLQNMDSMERTIIQTISLKPDRIAFYSYAHVPWTIRGQRLFDENDLPNAQEKLNLYQLGKKLFLENGYRDIGMDHFALENDTLYKASVEGKVFRNFMGYTTSNSKILLGLGVSAISDTGNAFMQNEKNLTDYYLKIFSDKVPLKKGYFLSAPDISFKNYILDLSCKGSTLLLEKDQETLELYSYPELEILKNDGLINWTGRKIIITNSGKQFVRNICRAFDIYLLSGKKTEKIYSKAV